MYSRGEIATEASQIIAAKLNAAKCSFLIGSFWARDAYAVILLVGYRVLLSPLSKSCTHKEHGPSGEIKFLMHDITGAPAEPPTELTDQVMYSEAIRAIIRL